MFFCKPVHAAGLAAEVVTASQFCASPKVKTTQDKDYFLVLGETPEDNKSLLEESGFDVIEVPF